MRGGVVEDVFVRDLEIGEVGKAAVEIDMLYEEGDQGSFVPVVRNVRVERLSVARAPYALWVEALERSPVQGLLVRGCRFSAVEKGSQLNGVPDLVLEDVTMAPAAGKAEP
jgi:hypothetical protein